MTTMLETLDETAAAYTSKTRAVDPKSGGCQYFVDGNCCAVGRCMLHPERYASFFGDVHHLDKLDSLLKPEYQGFPIDFWSALQDLHDWDYNWDENGLTEDGEKKVATIKEDFDL